MARGTSLGYQQSSQLWGSTSLPERKANFYFQNIVWGLSLHQSFWMNRHTKATILSSIQGQFYFVKDPRLVCSVIRHQSSWAVSHLEVTQLFRLQLSRFHIYGRPWPLIPFKAVWFWLTNFKFQVPSALFTTPNWLHIICG